MEIKSETTAAMSDKLRSEFLSLLHSRRNANVLSSVAAAKPVTDPMFQESPRPTFSEAIESCPKEFVENFKEKLIEENLYLIVEEGEQGRLPVLILSLTECKPKKRPAIVFLHSTNKCKEWLRPLLEAYASRGYIAIAIDSRYHGERAKTMTTYRDALVQSWKNGDTMPFIFDTVWDLIKLADYLTRREDIDHSRIGIFGESLGGMHAWFAAAADTLYSVVVPIIGVQGFRWAMDNDKWQARVDSIKAVFAGTHNTRAYSTEDAEALGVLHALHWALSLNFTHIILESDCQNIIKKLQGLTGNISWRSCSIIEDITGLAASFDYLVFQYVHRSCNSIAHYVAKEACQSPPSTWIGNVPPGISQLLTKDAHFCILPSD